jgi:putative membrane protein
MKILRPLVAGAIGGLIGAAAMGSTHVVATKVNATPPPKGSKGGDATEKVANAIARQATGRSLARPDRKKGGQLVHFAFGASVGALYGLLASKYPIVTGGGGTLFGAGVYVGAHLIGVPALGLAPSASENGVAAESAELASHLVYGATTEKFRRALSKRE